MGFSVILPVVAALVLPVAAHAQKAPSQSGRSALGAFNSLDRDGDHALNRAELQARGRESGADSLFTLLDSNGDGRLAVRELGAANGALLARFDAYDVNKDGFVSRQEFPNFVDPRLMAALDRDRDGRLALSEIRPAFAGANARPLPQEPVRPARAAKAKEKSQPICWITGFGSDQWTIEVPVVSTACRTQ
ncbi:MAG: hypothetical protein NVV74_13785 [Magnetospirillum sp.]|nr:hypothetical protein [Magnetospirillum sp.]